MENMLQVELIGGLGNQLFQIANGYALAKEHNLKLVFSNDNYRAGWHTRDDRPPIWDGYLKDKRDHFNVYSPDQLSAIPWSIFYENGFYYKPINLSKDYPYHKVSGYFQSSQYFNKYKEEIRSLLQVPDNVLSIAKDILEQNSVTNVNDFIVAHVRRGDYLMHQAVHHTTSVNYFNTARSYIENSRGNKHKVVWVSEDPQWVNDNLKTEGDVIISNSDFIIDFAILSMFPDIILSNSTFSWWATWLNPLSHTTRHICCPDKWFGSDGPQDYETIFEDNWIRIKT